MTRSFESNARAGALALRAVVAAVATFAVVAALCAQTSSAQTATGQTPGTKFVLTRHDTIVEGRLIDRGESYSVEFPQGGSISISKLDAVFIADSREEIYRRKTSETRMEDVNEVLKLADWADRRGMAPEAIRTMTEIAAASNDEAERAALQKKIDALTVAEKFRTNAKVAREQREAAAAMGQTAAVRPAQANPALSPQDQALDAWGRAVPPAALERFSRKALPAIQKRCANPGCHAEGAAESTLVYRPKGIGAAQRLALLYNLRETVRYVDFSNLEASPLLAHPAVAGLDGERLYPFGNDRYSTRDCDNFVSWFNTLSKEPKLAELAAKDRAERPGAPSLRQQSAFATGQGDVPGGAFGNRAEPENFSELFEDDAQPNQDPSAPQASVFQQGQVADPEKFRENPLDDVNSPESRLVRAGLLPKKKYRDDFDPAIFNDRYHPNKTQ